MLLCFKNADFLRDSSEAVSFCEEQVDCSNIPGTKCINGTCICETGTCVESEGVKVTKIGETCEETDVCSINNATCVDGKCKCVEGFMASQSERECLEGKKKKQTHANIILFYSSRQNWCHMYRNRTM